MSKAFIDLGDALAEALQQPRVLDALADRVVEKFADRMAQLQRAGDRYQPLYEIIGCTPAAARMKVARDEKLADLGIKSGKRLLFKPSEVVAHLATKKAAK